MRGKTHSIVGRPILVAVALVAAVGVAAGWRDDRDTGPGAGTPPPKRPAVSPAPGDHLLALDHAGVERSWVLHAPPGYRPGPPVPLVVALHGRPQPVEKLRETSGLDRVADNNGFLVAYPKGLNDGWSALSCCGTVDDVGFVRALVDELVKRWSVDPDRVYATGFSNGAEMSFKLAVEAADVFAAIAPVSGGFTGAKAASDTYRPTRPVPMITFLGRDDSSVEGFYTGLLRWQRQLGCTVGEPLWVDQGKTVNRTVSPCADGSEVVDYTVNGMGHAWPSSTGYPAAVDATELIWEFFAAHPRRT